MSEQASRGELNSALREVLESKRQEAADTRAAKESARRREGNSVPAVLLVVVAWGVLAWLWMARPAFIFDVVDSRPTMSAAQLDATARFALYLEKSRIDAYTKARGRLPTQLADAGPVEEGVVYHQAGGRYVLTREVNGVPLRLTSSMNADSFLGNSLQVLRDAE